MKKFWDKLKHWMWKAWVFLKHWLTKPFVWIFIIVIAIFGIAALMLGMDPNMGGLIGKLLGKKRQTIDPIATANMVPEGRRDKDGNEIPLGIADDNGFTQWEVKKIDEPKGIFRDKSVVVVKDKEGKPKELRLPKGVKDTDVDQVIEVKPKEFVVKIKDNSKIKVGDLFDNLP